MSKTENNLENKSAFFAQYWGQTIIIDSPLFTDECENVIIREKFKSLNDKGQLDTEDYSTNIEYCALELTPLSQMSSDDIYYAHSIINHIDVKNIDVTYSEIADVIDYLRSKGYAVPWRDLSVVDLITYGWVKLKTE